MTGEIIRLDIGALTRRLGVSRMTVTRMVADGRLPPPVYLCGKRLWTLDQVLGFEAEHITNELPPETEARTARAREGKAPRAGTRRASAPGGAAPTNSAERVVRHEL